MTKSVIEVKITQMKKDLYNVNIYRGSSKIIDNCFMTFIATSYEYDFESCNYNFYYGDKLILQIYNEEYVEMEQEK